MSATIPRQTSFESPLQRRLSEDQLEMLQNRSFSVRVASDRYAPGLPEEPTSPLKRFARAKLDISKAFSHVRERLGDARIFLEQVYGKAEVSPVSSLLERCTKIDDVLSRDHMKVAFFGRTSNGKSTVINALLHGKVLPAGIGHTTNCFCSVIGHDSSDGYLLKPGSEEKHSVKVGRGTRRGGEQGGEGNKEGRETRRGGEQGGEGNKEGRGTRRGGELGGEGNKEGRETRWGGEQVREGTRRGGE